MKTNTKTVKRGRGRPEKPVNFNFTGNSFTIDSVLKRYNGKGKKGISRGAVYTKIRAGIQNGTMKEAARVSAGRGHPTYRYSLILRKKPTRKTAAPKAQATTATEMVTTASE